MPIVRIPEPFDHPEWLFELRYDGFGALAHVDGHQCRLVSRNGHTFKHRPYLSVEIAHALRADSAVLDGEIACLNDDGRTNLHKLLLRRDWPSSSPSTCRCWTAMTCGVCRPRGGSGC